MSRKEDPVKSKPVIEQPLVCSSCKEPDHPLDDVSKLCYTCWLVACYEESSRKGAHPIILDRGEEE